MLENQKGKKKLKYHKKSNFKKQLPGLPWWRSG